MKTTTSKLTTILAVGAGSASNRQAASKIAWIGPFGVIMILVSAPVVQAGVIGAYDAYIQSRARQGMSALVTTTITPNSGTNPIPYTTIPPVTATAGPAVATQTVVVTDSSIVINFSQTRPGSFGSFTDQTANIIFTATTEFEYVITGSLTFDHMGAAANVDWISSLSGGPPPFFAESLFFDRKGSHSTDTSQWTTGTPNQGDYVNELSGALASSECLPAGQYKFSNFSQLATLSGTPDLGSTFSGFLRIDLVPCAVPEPSSLLLAAFGAVALVWRRTFRRR